MLALIDESVVPVASKNTKNGETPVSRTALAFNTSGPLVAEHPKLVGGGGVGGGGDGGGGGGGGGEVPALTLTVADCAALPPDPVQVSVYWVVAVSAAVLFVPLTGCAPLQAPEAVQAVAFVEDQLSVVD